MSATILVVDDSAMARKMLIRSLPASWDVTVRQACNGVEALQEYHQGDVDVMFLDLTMPVMDGYMGVLAEMPPPRRERVEALTRNVDLEYLREDMPMLLSESRDGLDRVKNIVQDLKDFSRVGESEKVEADLNHCLDSTLNVVVNEIKYKAEIVKQYGQLPPVECVASQLNQVFMNLLVNAAQAIEERGVITLSTGCEGDKVFVAVRDSGCGIPPDKLNRIFDPFFTTKPVGTGTELGLSVSYSIVEKHGGRIDVTSKVGEGTEFKVWLPLRASDAEAV